MSEEPASDLTKTLRLPLLVRRVSALRRSRAMREMWERRRAQMQEFLDDDTQSDSVGVDAELDELPETI